MKHLAVIITACALLLCGITSPAQDIFSLELVPSTSINAPAVHSGAFGSYQGYWYFIGGRKNGLHGFQTPFAFPNSGINEEIYFVNPATNQQWSASTTSLPDSIREAITSSNMQFYLRDSILYMIGGYGWKDAIQNFITWPTLTAINLNTLLAAIQNNQSIAPAFRQLTDTTLAVCGAHLHRLDSTFYLVFGHRFDGYYDRTDSTGFHVQVYTHEIRKFEIQDNGSALAIKNYRTVRDTVNFRRRDYNLLPFRDPYRGNGLLAYSGVFRKGIDLPYFNCIEIYPDTFIVRNDFSQNLSQYHSAVASLYDSTLFTQHHLFFGGMSMYYTDTLTGQLVTDSFIPFVQTISDVVRDIDMKYHEFDAGVRMPALLGTNAYFFYDDSISMVYEHHVHLNEIQGRKRIGFITGGIESPELNINGTDPSLSSASTRVFEVYVNKQNPNRMTEVQHTLLDFYAVPNPLQEETTIMLAWKEPTHATLQVLDAKGASLAVYKDLYFNTGKQKHLLDMRDYPKGVYTVLLTTPQVRKAIRLVKK